MDHYAPGSIKDGIVLNMQEERTRSNSNWELIGFLSLAAFVVLLPSLSASLIGLEGAAILAIFIAVIWCKVLPTTCRSGGYIASIVALLIIGNAMIFVLLAMVTRVKGFLLD